MTQTIKPESIKTELLRVERWEDEGGQTAAIESPTSTGRFVRPMLKTAGKQHLPRLWNTKFVIEPFQAGTGFDLSKRDAAAKK